MKKLYKIFTLISILLLPYFTSADEIPNKETSTEEKKQIIAVAEYIEKPVAGKEVAKTLKICLIGNDEVSFCEEFISFEWRRSKEPQFSNEEVATIAENGYYYRVQTTSEYDNEYEEKMTKISNAATQAGYEINIDDDTLILYINELSFTFKELNNYTGLNPAIFAVGGIDKTEYIVPDLIIGEKPSSTITVKTLPDDALTSNTVEIVWSKSIDGENFEAMTETDVFEQNFYYKFSLKDETTLYSEKYNTENGLFTDSHAKVFVNGEEKQLIELKLQPKVAPPVITEQNPNTGDIISLIQIASLGAVLLSTMFLIKRTRKSN